LEEQRQANAGEAWMMLARVLLNLDEFITRE
jgi:cytochrome c-type biogenesis protein CcmH/NrfG